ncbi:MAG: hypothetical protein WC757_04580 [Candidatus Paceibacterota bacterium]|jgi:hypothetical protein
MDPLKKKPISMEAQNTQIPRGTFMPQSEKEIPFEEKGFDTHSTERRQETIPTFRTFESDTIDTIKNNHESMASITLAEHMHRASLVDTTKKESPEKNLLLIIFSLILLVAGIGAVWFVFFVKTAEPVIQPMQVVPKEILTPDASNTIEISPLNQASFIKAVQEKIIEPVNQTGLVALHFSAGSTTITTDQFLKTLSPEIPPALIRALDPVFSFGLYKTAEEEAHPYIMFKVLSYENAFANMLAWERDIINDTKPVLTASTPVITTTIASSTASTTPPQVPKAPDYSAVAFTDAYMKNKDIRIAYQNRKPLLMYSFVDRNTLVITADESTLKELITRITKTEFVR